MSATAVAIGIDVGGTSIKGLALNTSGEILAEAEPVPTPLSGAEDVAAAAAGVARTLLDEFGDGTPVGVCVPGIVDEVAGVGIYSANLGWKDAPLRNMLERRIGAPVAFGHDVRSGALAEALWGAHCPDCLYVAIGTGIASGLIMGGRPAPVAPWGGELGQIPVADPDDPTQLRPLETVASAANIARRGREAGLVPPDSGARLLQEIAEAAATSPEDAEKIAHARRIYESSLSILGEAIAVVIHQIGTVDVVIGGGLSKGGEFILGPIRRALQRGCSVVPAPEVKPARLGSASQAMGAAASAFIAHDVPIIERS